MKLAEDMGKLALEKQKALSADINTIERAGKQPAIAKKYGIIVGDPESVKAKVKELKAKRAAWDNWASDPELVDQIRRELAGETVVEPTLPEEKPKKEAPIVKYRKEAAEIEASLPKVAKGYTRLYRGNRPGEVGTGRMFTNSLDGIALPFADAYKGPLSYIDVKTEDLDKYVSTGAVADNAEFSIPEDIAATATVIDRKKEKAEEKTVSKEEEVLLESSINKFYSAAKRHHKAAETHFSRIGGKKQAAFEKIFDGIEKKYKELGYNSNEAYDKTQDAYNEAMTRLYAEEFDQEQQRLTNGRLSVKRVGPREYKLYEDGKEIASGRYDDVYFAAAEKRAEYQKDEFVKGSLAEEQTENLQGTMPSFELEPEQKQTPADKKAAAEREEKEIADREREFFTLTPRTPEQGAGNYLQQDMIGAMGLTEAEFKKGIDKNSTEPGEPLVLRDVTMEESDRYNDDANANVDDEIISQH